VARDYLVGRDDLEPIDRAALVRRLRAGSVVLIDVRPAEEYRQAHIQGAISVPLDQVPRWASKAPRRKPVVAYCRGPYCVYALQAVAALRERGVAAVRAEDGVSEWRAAGLPLVRGEVAA
jgi:ArsR family transcriptional regulator